jgi:hypothetical protein
MDSEEILTKFLETLKNDEMINEMKNEKEINYELFINSLTELIGSEKFSDETLQNLIEEVSK